MVKIKKFVLVALGVLLTISIINFASTRKAAKKRLASYEAKSKTIDTSYGKLTYIDEGNGEPIISFHGICGGYDQAYDTLASRVDTYRILAPSRFGYTGSDMPENATIEMQTDAFVELLDALNIEKTYLLATSAGSTSAIKFALRHPERTKGLILYCSGYPRMEAPEKELTYVAPPSFLCNDFCMWLISPLFQPIMGMEQSTLKMIMPFKDKKDGIVFDGKVTNTVMYNNWQNYDLSNLKVPVLMLHSKDDKLADFNGVKIWTNKIPDCTAKFFEDGGHLMAGHTKEVDAALDAFIAKTQ